jgi:hypothetical protein
MGAKDGVDGGYLKFITEDINRVCAKEIERIRPEKLVPQFLQAYRGGVFPRLPKKPPHFTVRAQPVMIRRLPELSHRRSDDAANPVPIRLGARHDLRQRLARIEKAELPFMRGRVWISSEHPDLAGERFPVFCG